MVLKTFKEGFTLVELSLSMVFIGVLSVAIVLIISDTISSYRRGMTLNQINTMGMDLVDDFRTAVQNSTSKSVLNECLRYYNESTWRTACENDGGLSFVAHTKTSTITLFKNEKSFVAPIYGAFCTGNYSYIWNTGYYNTVNSGAADYASFSEKDNKVWAELQYTNSDNKVVKIVGSLSGYYNSDGSLDLTKNGDGTVGDKEKPFRLLKVADKNRAVCAGVARKNDRYNTVAQADPTLDNVFMIDASYGKLAVDEVPVDLVLEDSENDLALYSLEVAKPAESTTRKNAFYSVSFILGTIRGGVDIKAQGKNCKTPTDYENEEFDYCAINKFSFAVQAGGE